MKNKGHTATHDRGQSKEEVVLHTGDPLLRLLRPYSYLSPALAVLVVFVVIPAIRIFVFSFQKHSFITEPAWIGLRNYGSLLAGGPFLMALLNSFVYLLVTPILITLSLAVAFLLDGTLRGAKLFRGIYFLPVVTPIVVVGIIWRWILNEDVGLLNYLLLAAGITSEKLPWLSVYPLNLIAVMGVTVWRGLGYYAVIFLAGLTAIPREIEEAASIDGASRLRILLHITIPQLRPTIALVAVISSISALKVFDELAIVLPGAPSAEKTLVPLIYQSAFLDFDLGAASAMSVVLFVLTLGFSLLNARFWREK